MKILISMAVLMMTLSCGEMMSNTNEFGVSGSEDVTLETFLASAAGARISNPDLCKADAKESDRIMTLSKQTASQEGNGEGVCKNVNGEIMCFQRGYTSSGWGHELPKNGIALGETMRSYCRYIGKVLGKISGKPSGLDDATYTIAKVSVKSSIRNHNKTSEAYLVTVNTLNKFDKTKKAHRYFFEVNEGRLLGAGFKELPGRNYGASGKPEAEIHFIRE